MAKDQLSSEDFFTKKPGDWPTETKWPPAGTAEAKAYDKADAATSSLMTSKKYKVLYKGKFKKGSRRQRVEKGYDATEGFEEGAFTGQGFADEHPEILTVDYITGE